VRAGQKGPASEELKGGTKEVGKVYSAKGIDWDAVVAHHRQLLSRVVEMLFSLVIGLDEGKEVTTVPRCTRDYVYRILRPAESALRRLIMIAARDLKLDDATRSSVILGLEATTSEATSSLAGTHSVSSAQAAMQKTGLYSSIMTVDLGLAGIGPRPKPATKKPRQAASTRPPVFALIDPLKHFDFGPRRRYGKSIPRITWLDGRDLTPFPEIRLPEPGDPVDATRLCRRLVALKNALENLDREAQRLARWKARRDWSFKALRGEFGPASEAKLKGPNARKLRSSPMRPGYPPGRRKRPRYEIDAILKELHTWAHYSEETNTS